MARRGQNIYKRKDGRYEGRCIMGRHANGKVIYKSVYDRSYMACEKKLIKLKASYLENDFECEIYGTGTLKEFMQYWLHEIVKQSVKPSTFSNYIHYNEKWIEPYFKEDKINQLNTEQIQQFLSYLGKQGLSPGSIRNIYRTLKSVMKTATVYHYIKKNPCLGVVLPEYKPKPVEALSLDDQRKLEQASRGQDNLIGLIVLLSLYTGLRIGEICSLTVDDIDLQRAVISVSKTRQRIQKPHSTKNEAKTYVITDTAKSESSNRLIPLPPFMLGLLHPHLEHVKSRYLFTLQGRPLEPRILQMQFKQLLKTAEIQHVNFHALRHTFATRCMEKCVDVKTLSELLGHSSAKITLDLYAHSRFEHKQEVMNRLQELQSIN